MASEPDFLRDQAYRLNVALARYRDSPTSGFTQGEDVEGDPAAPWISDKGLMARLIAEYDRHMQQMEAQLKLYQKQMVDVKASLEQLVRENERLHAEQRLSVEKQLQCVSADGDAEADSVTISNLEEQLRCAVEEKDRAIEMYEAAAQELDRLQKLYQSSTRDEHIHAAQRQHVQNQTAQLRQSAGELQAANRNLESTNQQLVRTIGEQGRELEELRQQLRQAKQSARVSEAKADEMTRLAQSVQERIQREEEHTAEAQGREEASDRRLRVTHAALLQLESRLEGAIREAEEARKKEAAWEKRAGELQNRCSALQEEKYEALRKLRDAAQLAEEAALQRDQVQLREKQKVEEVQRMKEAMKRWVEEAPVRTRKEVEAVRKQCNAQIQRLTEELSALHLECSDKESRLERAQRERKVVEEELERVYGEGHYGEADPRKTEALHRRCLSAERMKEELELTLNTTRSDAERQQLEWNEELERCRDEVRRLQALLIGARSERDGAGEDRVRLQQENQELLRETQKLRKEMIGAQRAAKQQISQLEQELALQERHAESRLKEACDVVRRSESELRRRLETQQNAVKSCRDHNRQLLHAIASLREELVQQKQRYHQLEIQHHESSTLTSNY